MLLTSCTNSLNLSKRSSWDLVGKYLPSHNMIGFHIMFIDKNAIKVMSKFDDIMLEITKFYEINA